MHYRPSLDVSGYIDNLGDSTAFGGRVKPPPIEDVARDQRAREDRYEPLRDDFLSPRKAGVGPAYASSCTDLELRPIWDVNGYYRMFGFAFPYQGITKRMLRLEYHRLGGESSWLMTQVLRLLANTEYLREYNLAPYGEPFFDAIQQQLLKEGALHEAARRTTDQQKPIDKAEILDEWGYDFDPNGDPDSENVRGVVHDPEDPSEEDQQAWPWGYYLWGSHSSQIAKLAQWQGPIAIELAARNVHMRFAVGFFGRQRSHSEWVTAVIGPHQAFFVREDVEPTDGHAAAAVASVLGEHTDETVREDRTSMSDTKPKFGRGGQAAKEKAKAQNLRHRTSFLSLKDGESTIIRLIDDGDESGWIHVMQHAFVPTKPQPKDYDGDNWPKRMGAVCRHDDAFAGLYQDCYICDNMTNEETGKPYRPALRLWARAVIREEVKGTQEMADEGKIKPFQVGKRVGLKDKIIDVPEFDNKGDATGNTVQQFDVVLLNFGMKNFFGALQGAYEIYGTVLDRDFVVSREGGGTETDYQIVPLDQIRMGTDGAIYTLEDPEVRAKYLDVVDMEDYIAKQASDDHYAWFDPTKTRASKKKSSSKAKSTAQDDDEDEDQPEPSAQKPTVNAAALAQMRERAARRTKKAEPEPEAEAAADEDEASTAEMANYS